MTADPLARLREQVARAQCRYFREVVRGERGSGCECEDGDACIQWLGCADAALSLIANSEDARQVVGAAMLARCQLSSTPDTPHELAAAGLAALSPSEGSPT